MGQKYILIFLFVFFITIIHPIEARRSSINRMGLNELHNTRQEGFEGSHYVAGNQFRQISNNMSRQLGFPEQYVSNKGPDIAPNGQNNHYNHSRQQFFSKPRGQSFQDISQKEHQQIDNAPKPSFSFAK